MNSEQFLLRSVRENFDGKLYIRPNIPDKILINAASKVASGVNTGLVIAILDVSLLGDGKEGIVFCGDAIYLHESFSDIPDTTISLKELVSVNYEETESIGERGKARVIKRLTAEYDDDRAPIAIQSENISSSLKSLRRVLQGIIDNVDFVQTTKQDLQLKDLGDKVTIVYFELVINYLQNKENGYRELAEIMANNHLTQTVNDALRAYRFGEKQKITNDVLIATLREEVPFGSQAMLFEAMIKDLMLTKDTEQLEKWQDDQELLILATKLGVNEKKLDAFAHFSNMQQTQIRERLDDNQVKSLVQESVSVLTSAGVVAGSLVATASPTVLIAMMTISTGGLALVGLGIGAASVGVYTGMKHLTSGKDAERFAIRNELLQDRIEKLTGAQDYLINDINYLSDNLSDSVANYETQSAQFAQIKAWVERVKQANRATQADVKMRQYALKEKLLTSLPTQIDVEKLNALADKFPRKEQNISSVQAAYDEEWHINDQVTIKVLKQAQDILDQLDYGKLITVANVKSVTEQVATSDSVQNIKSTTKDTLVQVVDSDAAQDIKATGKKMLGRFSKFMGDRED